MGSDAGWEMGLRWNGTGTGTLGFTAELTIPAGYRCQCAPITHTGTVAVSQSTSVHRIKMIWPPQADTPPRTKNIVHPEVLLD
jgi:hypothetical protein